MDSYIFLSENAPFDVEAAAKTLNFKNEAVLEEMRSLAAAARKIAAPKALYKRSKVVLVGDDKVVLDGVEFKSRVLRVNLERATYAFPFVATCGVELDSWAESFTDPAGKTLAAIIAGMGLGPAFLGLLDEIKSKFHIDQLSYMTPGSIEDWPLTEQKPLFTLLGDVRGKIGVDLLDSLFMKPAKTASGIIFANSKGYENCELCEKGGPNCPGRRAPFDPEKFDREFRKK